MAFPEKRKAGRTDSRPMFRHNRLRRWATLLQYGFCLRTACFLVAESGPRNQGPSVRWSAEPCHFWGAGACTGETPPLTCEQNGEYLSASSDAECLLQACCAYFARRLFVTDSTHSGTKSERNRPVASQTSVCRCASLSAIISSAGPAQQLCRFAERCPNFPLQTTPDLKTKGSPE